MLLEAGALPIEVAAQLAASAEPGDDIAVATLLDAAEALVATDSETAAQFGRRALEIAPTHHPRRGELVGITAIALHMAGRSEEAIAVFADTALREILPSEQEAEVRLRIAGMFAISPEIRIASGRAALMLPDVPEIVRARHLACLFHNLVTAGRIGDARTTLEEARALIATTHDVRASFTLRLAESALDYVDDRFSPALELVTAAYRDGIFAGDDQRLRLAHMWHGEVLSALDRDDEAFAIAADGLAAAERDRPGVGVSHVRGLARPHAAASRGGCRRRQPCSRGASTWRTEVTRPPCSTPPASSRWASWRSTPATAVSSAG